MGRGPRSKRGKEKRREHEKALLERRLEWALMRRAVFHDRERGEAISTTNNQTLNIERGEVLYDSRGFVTPALDPDAAWRATLLRIQNLEAEGV